MTDLTIEQTEAVRETLLAAMREWSEDNYCAGWLTGLDRRLYREGGTFEVLGRLVGWPMGVEGDQGWVDWDEVPALFAAGGGDR